MRTICVLFAYKKVSFRVKINHIFAEKVTNILKLIIMKARRILTLSLLCIIGILFCHSSEIEVSENTQNELIEFTKKMIESNNQEIVLPLEVNSLVGDSATVAYSANPDWPNIKFSSKKGQELMILPLEVKTSVGTINSQLEVKRLNTRKFHCLVRTFVPIQRSQHNNTKFSGMVLESGVNGTFLKGDIFSNGFKTGDIEGENQNKVTIWNVTRADKQISSIYNESLKQKAQAEFRKNRNEKNISSWGAKSKEEERFINPNRYKSN